MSAHIALTAYPNSRIQFISTHFLHAYVYLSKAKMHKAMATIKNDTAGCEQVHLQLEICRAIAKTDKRQGDPPLTTEKRRLSLNTSINERRTDG